VSPRGGKQFDVWAQVAFYSSLAFILPAATVGGYLLGSYLDRELHSAPALAVVLGILGATAGIYEVLRIVARAEKREGKENTDDGADPS